MMEKKNINIGVEDANRGYKRFIDAWNRASTEEGDHGEVHLNFEDFAMLAAVLTPKRLEILRTLRRSGPMNVRALSQVVERDYKNVHVDSAALEDAGLIQRDEEGLMIAPWDVIDAHFRLVA